MHADLLITARKLLCTDPGGAQPSYSDKRRAVSTVYYALFHHILSQCADALAGLDNTKLTRARQQIYRSIDHQQVTDACEMARQTDNDFPKAITDYANLFCNAQKSRQKADYDPSESSDFNLPQALHKIGEAEHAISQFETVDLDHRRAFAILISVKRPGKKRV